MLLYNYEHLGTQKFDRQRIFMFRHALNIFNEGLSSHGVRYCQLAVLSLHEGLPWASRHHGDVLGSEGKARV
jgi:hypothetical protein